MKKRKIGAFEAKTKLSELLHMVERGEEIVITRRGRPVATLSPVSSGSRKASEVIHDLRALRRNMRLGDLDWKKLRDAGRK